eukprot:gene25217-31648_t
MDIPQTWMEIKQSYDAMIINGVADTAALLSESIAKMALLQEDDEYFYNQSELETGGVLPPAPPPVLTMTPASSAPTTAIWFVSTHDNVSNCVSQIDTASRRIARTLT